jgi:predicted enzyme related to lactoylglutathione lyase
MSNPIVHFEMWSPDPARATQFYTSVFDWKINYTPQLSYWLVDAGEFSGAGGINGGMFKPQPGELPAKIALYVQVDDVGAYIEKAKAAGAKVLVGETEIPGVGWSAILLDPEDRAFGLFKPLPREQ